MNTSLTGGYKVYGKTNQGLTELKSPPKDRSIYECFVIETSFGGNWTFIIDDEKELVSIDMNELPSLEIEFYTIALSKESHNIPKVMVQSFGIECRAVYHAFDALIFNKDTFIQ